MTMEKPSIQGDPEDAQAYLREFVQGEISYNPDKLAHAYLKLASEAKGTDQLAYQALAWAVGATRLEGKLRARIKMLEQRVESLERQRDSR